MRHPNMTTLRRKLSWYLRIQWSAVKTRRQIEERSRQTYWRTDLQLVRALRLRHLRYGSHLHLIHHGPNHYDWSFPDEIAAKMQGLGIVPIRDLCHFGLPDWLQNFQNPEVPWALANYAKALTLRYPWVRFYTPVNDGYPAAGLLLGRLLWGSVAGVVFPLIHRHLHVGLESLSRSASQCTRTEAAAQTRMLRQLPTSRRSPR